MADVASDGLIQTLLDADAEYHARLASLIHDQPLQTLAAASLRLDVLRDRAPDVAASVESIVDLLRETATRLRLLIALLELPDADTGLASSLQRLVSAAYRADVDVTLLVDDSLAMGERASRAATRIVADAVLTLGSPGALVLELGQSGDVVLLNVTAQAPSADLVDLLVRTAARAEASGGRLVRTTPDGGSFVVPWPR